MKNFLRIISAGIMNTILLNAVLGQVPLEPQVPPKPQEQQTDIPQIVLPPSDQEDLSPIKLTNLSVDINVTGFVCRTSTTMVFHNPNSRVLEGNLVFPLPENVTISGYALDVEGNLVDAVAVTKEKARVALEQEIRRGADPGIVEWTKGNQFKTRIFPLPANGTRTIRVDYVSTAEFDSQNNVSLYRLPLKFDRPIPKFALKMFVVRPTESPTIVSGDFDDLGFGTWSDGLMAQTEKTDFRPVRDLILEIPAVDSRKLIVEKSKDGYCYFAAAVETAPFENQTAGTAKKTININDVKTITVFWDASGSRSQTRGKELAFLKKLLSIMAGGSSSGGSSSAGENTVAVTIVPVRDRIVESEIIRHTISTADQAATLIESIAALPCDGATNLDAISSFSTDDSDLAILFTDGLNTWTGSTREITIPQTKKPLYVFSAGNAFDTAFLKQLARVNAGKYFNLESGTTETQATAFVKALASPEDDISIEGRNADVWPKVLDVNGIQPVQYICGRMERPSGTESAAEVLLFNGTYRQTIQVCPMEAKTPIAPAGESLRVLYAQTKLAGLLASQKENEPAIEQLGKDYSFVTPMTSLIVLETLEQYVEHDICPPETQPELRNQFLNIQDQQASQEKTSLEQARTNRLEYIQSMWNRRLEWWTKEYKYPKGFQYSEPSKQNARSSTGRVHAYGGGNLDQAAEAGEADSFADEDPMIAESAPLESAPLESAPAAPITPMIVESAPRDSAPRESAPPAPMMAAPTLAESAPVIHEMDRNRSARSMESLRDGTEEIAVDALSDDSLEKSGNIVETRTAAVKIQQWKPDSDYIEKISNSSQPYQTYIELRSQYASSPAFYIECSGVFIDKGQPEMAIRILSNLAEMDLENPQILRVLGYRLLLLEQPELAIPVFATVLTMRAEEPLSYRDLAIALTRRFEAWIETKNTTNDQLKNSIREDIDQALELYTTVVLGRQYQQWDNRFPEMELFALEEANALLTAGERAGFAKLTFSKDESFNQFMNKFICTLDCDIRISMTWHADNTDIDLWVTEPSNEKVYYSHNRSVIGGLLSCDYTQGYGPEEYMLRRAMPGEYRIDAHYFGSSAVVLLGNVTVQVDIYTNYGRANQKRQSIMFPLKKTGTDVFNIGSIKF